MSVARLRIVAADGDRILISWDQKRGSVEMGRVWDPAMGFGPDEPLDVLLSRSDWSDDPPQGEAESDALERAFGPE